MDANLLKKRYCLEIPDLPDQTGGINVVTVARWDTEHYDGRENGNRVPKIRHLLFFNEIHLPMRLNNRRIDVLISILGPDMSRWHGRKVGLAVGAVVRWGKTEADVVIDIRTHDQATPILPEHQRQPGMQLPAGTGQPRYAANTPAAPAHQGAMVPATPFDARPMGRDNVTKNLMPALAEQGATIDDVYRWLKRYYPDMADQISGKNPEDWPRGVAPPIREFLVKFQASPPGPPSVDPGPYEPVGEDDIHF